MILHPQLNQDCIVLGQWDLCAVLLMKDANYPWLILVPQREDITEIYQLSEVDQQQLMRESSRLSQSLMTLLDADKINIAALGNMVPQLHVHHVVRYKQDIAWPAPVWGFVPSKDYNPTELKKRVILLRSALDL